MLQQNPEEFGEKSIGGLLSALKIDPATQKNKAVQVGITFQWEILDCFLSPHSCTSDQVQSGILNFLNGAVEQRIPVEITLDPIQFYYETHIWNWWDPTLPGYSPSNVDNVEWVGWEPANATMIAWRDWGSQFRMPTPQPNLASPMLLNRTSQALSAAISTIRKWYENQSTANQKLLVGVKLGEEIDIGFNYYYYPNGNEIYKANPNNASADPKFGLNFSKGLSGGLPAMGYNMLRTLNMRKAGGPPTREEITTGIRNYVSKIVESCVDAWPNLSTNGLLSVHGGGVSDPSLIEWNSPMIAPAIPGYSFYFGPNKFHENPVGQPGLHSALLSYPPANMTFIVAESACFGCSSVQDWAGYFDTVFSNPYGRVSYLRYYNIEPFVASKNGVAGLHSFIDNFRN